ncbi:hypothetical protein AQUCO_00201410v1 [Aquilegia coerulea]|uniref:Uncharacterized protein n=1 Tax=Aquilegia coerulea TaxID=218851 RepID=A0A2G5F7W2_AQUCA|nr:hypothetical protein AQUCO_00201410v1 [Aquilegia coerulea]
MTEQINQYRKMCKLLHNDKANSLHFTYRGHNMDIRNAQWSSKTNKKSSIVTISNKFITMKLEICTINISSRIEILYLKEAFYH